MSNLLLERPGSGDERLICLGDMKKMWTVLGRLSYRILSTPSIAELQMRQRNDHRILQTNQVMETYNLQIIQQSAAFGGICGILMRTNFEEDTVIS
jgi:hypothetical protein